jgi:hypothetical protein
MRHIEYIKNDSIIPAIEGQRIPFRVRFLDKDDQPIAGAFIRFFLEKGGGTLVHPDGCTSPDLLLISITDCKGEAYVYYESDGVVGYSSILATVMEI